MRGRITAGRTPAGKDALAIKTGVGGLMDAEFLAQAFCLEAGFQEANTLAALARGAALGLITREDASSLVDNYKNCAASKGFCASGVSRGKRRCPTTDSALRRVAVRCGYATSAAFLGAVGEIRQAIRGVYARYFRPN